MNSNMSTNESFNITHIMRGVDKGQRHDALTQYVQWLGEHHYTMEEKINAVLSWNRLNRPPMYVEDVAKIVNDMLLGYRPPPLAWYRDGKIVNASEPGVITLDEVQRLRKEGYYATQLGQQFDRPLCRRYSPSIITSAQ